MKFILTCFAPALLAVITSATYASNPQAADVMIAAYYYPGHHRDPRWDKYKYPGFTEWDLVKAAQPRYLGHKQPRIPLWGYDDEADPNVMARKIDAAADHGIDIFIFDWYFFNDGPFLEGALDRGFLQAPNNQRLKFALMWANSDWYDVQGYNPANPARLLFPGKVTPETWDRICEQVITHYFKRPNYWCIKGSPYYSIYDLGKFIESFGSLKSARAALDRFRAKAVAAGFPGLHLNAIPWRPVRLPDEGIVVDLPSLCSSLGFDSVTTYTWLHHCEMPTFPESDYIQIRQDYMDYWAKASKDYPMPYFPNVTVGWDNSPRADPKTLWDRPATWVVNPVLVGNTPWEFRESVRIVKERLLASPVQLKIISLNAWNEWPEGSYLEPDRENGYDYLKAIKTLFMSSK